MHRSLGSGECFVTKFLPPHRLWVLREYVLHSSTRERRALLVPEAPLQSLEDESRLFLVKLIDRRLEEPRLKVLVIRPPGPIQQRQDRLRRSLLIKLPRYLYEEDRQRARRIQAKGAADHERRDGIEKLGELLQLEPLVLMQAVQAKDQRMRCRHFQVEDGLQPQP